MSTASALAHFPRRKIALTLNVDFNDIVEQLQPDPVGMINAVRAYLDRCAQQDAETVPFALDAAWLDRRKQWLDRMGKLLTAKEVVELSASMNNTGAVHKAHKEGRLFAVEIGERVFFPLFQFGQQGGTLPWVAPLVAALSDSDSRLQFISAGRTALQGRSYAEAIRNNPDDDFIAGMLRSAEEQAASEAR